MITFEEAYRTKKTFPNSKYNFVFSNNYKIRPSKIYYFFPEEHIKAIHEFKDHYNNYRCHESLHNLTPADVYYDKVHKILQEWQQIKMKTIADRRKNYIQEKMEFVLTI